MAKQTKSPLTLANGLFGYAIPLKLRKVFTPHYEMAIFITYTMTNMKSTLTFINHMHLVWGKRAIVNTTKILPFYQFPKKSEIFYDFFQKKERHRYHHDISLPKKNNTH